MVLWDVIAYSIVDRYGRFRETCCFCLQVALGLLNWHIFQWIQCCYFISVIIKLVRDHNNCSHEARCQLRNVWSCIFTPVLLALYYRLAWSAGGKISGKGETNPPLCHFVCHKLDMNCLVTEHRLPWWWALSLTAWAMARPHCSLTSIALVRFQLIPPPVFPENGDYSASENSWTGVPWLRQLLTSLSLGRPGFDFTPDYVGFPVSVLSTTAPYQFLQPS